MQTQQQSQLPSARKIDTAHAAAMRKQIEKIERLAKENPLQNDTPENSDQGTFIDSLELLLSIVRDLDNLTAIVAIKPIRVDAIVSTKMASEADTKEGLVLGKEAIRDLNSTQNLSSRKEIGDLLRGAALFKKDNKGNVVNQKSLRDLALAIEAEKRKNDERAKTNPDVVYGGCEVKLITLEKIYKDACLMGRYVSYSPAELAAAANYYNNMINLINGLIERTDNAGVRSNLLSLKVSVLAEQDRVFYCIKELINRSKSREEDNLEFLCGQLAEVVKGIPGFDPNIPEEAAVQTETTEKKSYEHINAAAAYKIPPPGQPGSLLFSFEAAPYIPVNRGEQKQIYPTIMECMQGCLTFSEKEHHEQALILEPIGIKIPELSKSMDEILNIKAREVPVEQARISTLLDTDRGAGIPEYISKLASGSRGNLKTLEKLVLTLIMLHTNEEQNPLKMDVRKELLEDFFVFSTNNNPKNIPKSDTKQTYAQKPSKLGGTLRKVLVGNDAIEDIDFEGKLAENKNNFFGFISSLLDFCNKIDGVKHSHTSHLSHFLLKAALSFTMEYCYSLNERLLNANQELASAQEKVSELAHNHERLLALLRSAGTLNNNNIREIASLLGGEFFSDGFMLKGNAEVFSLQKQLSDQKSKIDNLIATLIRALQDVNNPRKETERRLSELISSLSKQLKSAQEMQVTLESEAMKPAANLEEKLRRVKAKVGDIEKDVERKRDEIEKEIGGINELLAAGIAEGADFAAAEDFLNKIQKDKERLERELAETEKLHAKVIELQEIFGIANKEDRAENADTIEGDLAKMQTGLKAIEGKRAEMQKRITEQEQKNAAEMKRLLEEQKLINSGLVGTLLTAQKKEEQQSLEIARLEMQKKEAALREEALRLEREETNRKLALEEEKVGKSRQEIAQLEAQAQQERDEFEKQKAAVSKKLKLAEEESQGIKTQLTAVNATLDKYQKMHDEDTKSLEELRKKAEAQAEADGKKIEELQGKLGTTEEKMEELKKQREFIESQQQATQENLVLTKKKLAGTENELNRIKEAEVNAMLRMEELEATKKDIEAQEGKLETENADLKVKLTQAEEAGKKSKLELEQKKRVEEDNKELKEEITSLTEGNASLKHTAEEIEETLKKEQQEKEQAAEQLKHVQANNLNLRSEMEKAEKITKFNMALLQLVEESVTRAQEIIKGLIMDTKGPSTGLGNAVDHVVGRLKYDYEKSGNGSYDKPSENETKSQARTREKIKAIEGAFAGIIANPDQNQKINMKNLAKALKIRRASLLGRILFSILTFGIYSLVNPTSFSDFNTFMKRSRREDDGAKVNPAKKMAIAVDGLVLSQEDLTALSEKAKTGQTLKVVNALFTQSRKFVTFWNENIPKKQFPEALEAFITKLKTFSTNKDKPSDFIKEIREMLEKDLGILKVTEGSPEVIAFYEFLLTECLIEKNYNDFIEGRKHFNFKGAFGIKPQESISVSKIVPTTQSLENLIGPVTAGSSAPTTPVVDTKTQVDTTVVTKEGNTNPFIGDDKPTAAEVAVNKQDPAAATPAVAQKTLATTPPVASQKKIITDPFDDNYDPSLAASLLGATSPETQADLTQQKEELREIKNRVVTEVADRVGVAANTNTEAPALKDEQ